MRTRISVHEPIDADLDAGAGDVVQQAVDPVPIDDRHPDAHRKNVSYRLRLSNGRALAGIDCPLIPRLHHAKRGDPRSGILPA